MKAGMKKTYEIFIPDVVVHGVKSPVPISDGDWSKNKELLAAIIHLNCLLKGLGKDVNER